MQQFLDICKDDRSSYVNAAERLLMAIGEPEIDRYRARSTIVAAYFLKPRNITLAMTRLKKDFYGMEETIEQIVSYLNIAEQGLEERKQILYLLGPVGGGNHH